MERVDRPCRDRPVETTLRLLGGDGSVAAIGKSAADGTLRIMAPRGRDRFVADDRAGPEGCPPVNVTIQPGRCTPADISWATGIR